MSPINTQRNAPMNTNTPLIEPRSFDGEAPANYAKKCPLVLVVDVSWSMENCIDQVNQGLQYLHQEALNNDEQMAESLEIGLVTFSGQAKTLIEPSLPADIIMPTLQLEKATDLGAGVIEGLSMLEGRINYLRSSGQAQYRSYCLLITDAETNCGMELEEIRQYIQERGRQNRFIFWPIGVKGCNMDLLHYLADEAVMPATELDPARIFEQIKLVTDSMKTGLGSADPDVQQANWMQDALMED